MVRGAHFEGHIIKLSRSGGAASLDELKAIADLGRDLLL